MTTITFNALNTAGVRKLPGFKMPNFVERRALLPDMQDEVALPARAFEIVSRAAAAAIPFAALAWLFIAR